MNHFGKRFLQSLIIYLFLLPGLIHSEELNTFLNKINPGQKNISGLMSRPENLLPPEKFYLGERLIKFEWNEPFQYLRSGLILTSSIKFSLYAGTYFQSPSISEEVIKQINLEKIIDSLENNSTVWSYKEMCVVNYDKRRILYPLVYLCLSPNYLILI